MFDKSIVSVTKRVCSSLGMSYYEALRSQGICLALSYVVGWKLGKVIETNKIHNILLDLNERCIRKEYSKEA